MLVLLDGTESVREVGMSVAPRSVGGGRARWDLLRRLSEIALVLVWHLVGAVVVESQVGLEDQ